MPKLKINKEFVRILSEHEKIPVAYLQYYKGKGLYSTRQYSFKIANGVFLDDDAQGGDNIIFLKDGLLHREDGPAVIYIGIGNNNPPCRWYLDGSHIAELQGKTTCDKKRLSLLILKNSNI